MTEPRTFYGLARGQENVERLAAIGREHAVRILYAVESGSRAWEFASTDSDWDVRFIYVHPVDWCLSVHEQRDVIEIPIDDELDISGWDLRKSLRLMVKGNPVLYEWLRSPILYLEGVNPFGGRRPMNDYLRAAESFYNPLATVHHYRSMAKGNFGDYLAGDILKLKKYFYVLRPVLACLWILRGLGQPPMRFQQLLEARIAARIKVRT